MTSATERLRALLDERGVEWSNGHGDCDGHAGTLWDGIGGRWYAGGMTGVRENRLYLETPADRTPEQAVAATLGPGTCHIDLVGYNEHEDRFQCRSCDWSMSVRRGTWPRFNYCPNCGRKVVEDRNRERVRYGE